jgi:hypothetical protein
VWRALVFPTAVAVMLFSQGGPLHVRGRRSKKKKPARKTSAKPKAIAKAQAHVVSRTDTLARSVVRRTSKTAGRAQRTLVSIVRWPFARGLRLLRLARYGFATRILGRR